MSLKVTVDLETCQGYACCMMEAPAVFDLDEAAGKVILLQDNPDAELRVQVESAARTCPSGSILVENG